MIATQFSQYKPHAHGPQPLVCHLKPGDGLYLPSFAWHDVESFAVGRSSGYNVAVNLWFEPNRVLQQYHSLIHQILLDGAVR
jgi:hypothetical protein